MTQVYNICFAVDDKYSKALGVAMASILLNATAENKFYFHILDAGISAINRTRIKDLKKIKDFSIKFYTVDNNMFEDFVFSKNKSSFATYYRFAISSLLVDVDKVLYLDADVLVKDNLDEIFNTDIDNFYIAGVEDYYKDNASMRLGLKANSYINAGVVLFNLQKMREDNIENNFLALATLSHKLLKPENDILNKVCDGNILPLALKWNVHLHTVKKSKFWHDNISFKEPTSIIHFRGKCKPWRYIGLLNDKIEFYKYLNKSPWVTFSTKYLQTIEMFIAAIFTIYFQDNALKYRLLGVKGKLFKKYR